MIIQYASDLHLENPDNREYIRKKPLLPKGEVLILAGDIIRLSEIDSYKDFFNYCSYHFAATYWIPGNHEHYGSDISKREGLLQENIRSNVWLVNNVAVEYKDLRIICSTMWSEIDKQQEKIARRLSDFKFIKYGNTTLNVSQYNWMHANSLKFIKDTLAMPYNGKNIVVSHHVPTYKNYPEKLLKAGLDEAFAVDLQEYIEGLSTQNIICPYWIYGHHHRNVSAFEVGNTSLVTNQLGYVKKKGHLSFNSEAIMLM